MATTSPITLGIGVLGYAGVAKAHLNALKKLHDFKWPMRWSRTREPNIAVSFCCPPNVVRIIAEMHNYVYALSPDTVWVNLYAASKLDTAWLDGSRIRLRRVPEIEFRFDEAIASQDRIEQILRDLHEEKRQRGGDDDDE